MIKHFTTAAFATLMICTSASPAVFAQSDGWQEIVVSDPTSRWFMRETGELFSGGPYSFSARTEHKGATLQLGCAVGEKGSLYERPRLELTFTPPAGTDAQQRMMVQYSVNGTPVAWQPVSVEAGRTAIASVAESGQRLAGEGLATAMNNAWKGDITVTFHESWVRPYGPAFFTHTFPFDEDEVGGVSEMVLAACGLI